MRGIIFYDYYQQGCGKMDRLIEEYQQCDIKSQNIIQVNKSKIYSIVFENGDEWSVAPMNDHSKGRSCNIAYIPYKFKNTALEAMIVMPCIKKRPFRAYNYY